MLRDLATGRSRAAHARAGIARSTRSNGRRTAAACSSPPSDTLEEPVFRVDAATGKVTRLTGDGHFGNVHALPGGGAIATMNSIAAPDDLYRLDAAAERPS